jgi:hypothetical protein
MGISSSSEAIMENMGSKKCKMCMDFDKYI